MRKLSLLFLAVMFVTSSCSEEEEIKNQLSDEDILSLVSLSVTGQGSPLIEQFTEVEKIINQLRTEAKNGKTASFCNTTESYSTEYENVPDFPYEYKLRYDFLGTSSCNSSSELSQFEFTLSLTGYLNNEYNDITYNNSTEMVLKDIDKDVQEYTGKWNVDMKYVMNDGSNFNGHHLQTFKFEKIKVNEYYQIIGGKFRINGRGLVSKGAYRFDVVITYNNDNTATVELNGKSYLMNMNTGKIYE